MNFESVGPSAVKSIRQRDFLKEWMRHYVPRRTLPAFAAFKPARIDDEMPDLMFYDVEYAGGEPRYLVTREGQRLIDAYGVTGIGKHLQDTISPPVWQYIEPIYRKWQTSNVAWAMCSIAGTHRVDARLGYARPHADILPRFGENGFFRGGGHCGRAGGRVFWAGVRGRQPLRCSSSPQFIPFSPFFAFTTSSKFHIS